ncbi:MAG: peptidoglycan DD-metalloendopeptidase family protein [Rhizobiales bacterium]|nr:peptidoglycan DD-metalloendopeptidase family protein [Hyphomicrobiales bacterium]
MRSVLELRPRRRAPLAVTAMLALAMAGCSSESNRFNSPFSNPFSSSTAETTGSVPAASPAPSNRVESRPLPPQPQLQPQPQPQYQSGPLPPPPATRPATVAAQRQYKPASYQPAPAVTGSVSAPPPAPTPPPVIKASTAQGNWNWNGGTAITVGPGETIDTIAHRYGVPSQAILQANGIAVPSMIQPGQRLVIPRYDYSTETTGSVGSRPAAKPQPSATAHTNAAPASGVHVVGPGDTLSKLSRMYRKPVVEIARANNIPPYAKLTMGDRLVIPGAPRTTAPAVAQPQPAGGQRMVSAAPPSNARMVTPAKNDPAPEEQTAVAEPSGNGPGFRWPARGRIITGYGPKTTGQQNDGINLAVPEGTPVKASDDGVVAYAGNELKGYGNLVLVRHANGFVTAYAHASELMVKRGDKVKRGQVIARSGQTGNVTSPQLHFEIRKGSTPVDPMQYLSGAS